MERLSQTASPLGLPKPVLKNGHTLHTRNYGKLGGLYRQWVGQKVKCELAVISYIRWVKDSNNNIGTLTVKYKYTI
jgi:hypothetical protein